jgi:hypothetical protein
VKLPDRYSPISKGFPPMVAKKEVRTEFEYSAIQKYFPRAQNYFAITTLPPDTLSDDYLFMPTTDFYILGILSSTVFAEWVKNLSDRDKITLRAETMFNNFPFPVASNSQIDAIEDAFETVLKARASFSYNDLSEIYEPSKMPPQILWAHQGLDKVVFELYGFPKEIKEVDIFEKLLSKRDELLQKNN